MWDCIDMEYILKNIPAYERANEQLNQVSKKWQSEVEKVAEEAKTLYKNYQSVRKKTGRNRMTTTKNKK